MLRSNWITLLYNIPISIIAFALVLFPKEALDASVKGLETWWKIVFPSLLPFFIVSELLIAFGVVKFIGILLEPIMRPFFRTPGIGGFVWAMGMVAGNPAGAKLTVRLRNENMLSQQEAEKIVAFTSSANPLFIFGAVSAGFFQNEKIGTVFALSHYVSNIFVGFLMRFYGKMERKRERRKFLLKEAFVHMHKTRIENRRPFGKILGDAVISSIQTLLMIGGFIIFFSVLNRLFTIIHITELFALMIQPIFSILHLPNELSLPFLSGLFEMTIGSKMVSDVENVRLLEKAIVVSFLLAFGGFSIQAQVGSILAESDIRFQPFFLGRCLQGVFASILTILLWKPVYEAGMEKSSDVTTVFLFFEQAYYTQLFQRFIEIGPIITIVSIIVYIFLYIRKHFLKR
ncbi:sporulation integral membrane protein YlbJ [Fervidibacillus halotolerans]|uniref:Sporulation integral membrane protein YlbJ n=1 Tax=Fervidibacillus halotolerans TaxID=2980027 RepID=A0A9E8M3G1_9BACI|nr:sporulation integral membrane protein YlbJ [Fervidibacillus halotolerans]WAA13704.1 sporulation integral membrane protein YlbJ [Fervidibacillus halotolerans]